MPSKPVRKTQHDPSVDRAVARARGRTSSRFIASVQAERGHLNSDAIATVADAFSKYPVRSAFGVASFYSLFVDKRGSPESYPGCAMGAHTEREKGVRMPAQQSGPGRGQRMEGRAGGSLGLCDCAPAALLGGPGLWVR